MQQVLSVSLTKNNASATAIEKTLTYIEFSRLVISLDASSRCWPKIVSHFHALGVSCGHIRDPWLENLGVRFLRLIIIKYTFGAN